LQDLQFPYGMQRAPKPKWCVGLRTEISLLPFFLSLSFKERVILHYIALSSSTTCRLKELKAIKHWFC